MNKTNQTETGEGNAPRMTKAYLGDSVYADTENGMVKLTTENGYEPSNTIYLEPEVLSALVNYAKHFNVFRNYTEMTPYENTKPVTAQRTFTQCHKCGSTATLTTTQSQNDWLKAHHCPR